MGIAEVNRDPASAHSLLPSSVSTTPFVLAGGACHLPSFSSSSDQEEFEEIFKQHQSRRVGLP